MRNLITIREVFHAQFLHIRNCNNLVQSDDFEIAYNLASEEERSEILLAIAEANREKIKNFIASKLEDKGSPFEQLTLRKLFEIAAHQKIPYYKQLSKTQLIEEIRNVAERLKKDSKRKHLQSKQTEYCGENLVGSWQSNLLGN